MEQNNIQTLSKETDIRRAKIEELKNQGINPYAEKFERTHKIIEARNLEMGTKVKLCGRMTSRRIMGKFLFANIEDVEAKIQISMSFNDLGEEQYKFFKQYVDLADFIGVEGELYATQTGEITVKCYSFKLLSKALNPLPEKWHGLTDVESKYRQRYLDLVTNPETREVFLGRFKLMNFIRRYLGENGFIEVETPILQTAVCGASAKPFLTHHNALDMECNLRIAPEVYLKQIIAGGFDRVFEIAKCFRNEGMDASHLQEFTQVEWYASYWNFEDNIKFFTNFLQNLLMEVKGTLQLEKDGKILDFSGEFKRINYTETVNSVLGFNVLEETDVSAFKQKLIEKGFKEDEVSPIKTVGGLIDLVYKRKIRPDIVQPTILFNYPASIVPLARVNDNDNRLIDMFQVLVNGEEICKAYSELVDPIIQRKKLEEQALAKADGDEEAMDLDEGFILAMEHGMPPISGLGMGIDRLMMMLFNQPTIRDIILFPQMKPESK